MGDSRRASPFALRALAVLVLAGSGAPSMADSLPNASTSVFCSVEGNTFRDALNCEFGGGTVIPSSVVAEAVPAVPAVRAEALSSVNAVLGAGSSATALYWFAVEGPTLNEQVPLLMDVRLETTGGDDSLAIARIIVSTSIQPFVFVGEACSGLTIAECDVPPTLEETIHFPARTGSRQDTVTLFAQAQAFVNRDAAQSATAFADPYIYVDPAFANAHLYHVIVSPGIGNAPPVPEPGALWLLAAGLLSLKLRLLKAPRARPGFGRPAWSQWLRVANGFSAARKPVAASTWLNGLVLASGLLADIRRLPRAGASDSRLWAA